MNVVPQRWALWNWLEARMFPIDPPAALDTVSEQRTDLALRNADAATREMAELKRRARAVGIDVDVVRGWGPRGE